MISISATLVTLFLFFYFFLNQQQPAKLKQPLLCLTNNRSLDNRYLLDYIFIGKYSAVEIKNHSLCRHGLTHVHAHALSHPSAFSHNNLLPAWPA